MKEGSKRTDLLICQESNVEVFVHLEIVDAAADCRHHDDLPLLALKLLHRPHLIPTKENIYCHIFVNEHNPHLLNNTLTHVH